MTLSYRSNPGANLGFTSSLGTPSNLSLADIREAILRFDEIIEKIYGFDVDIQQLLGMRNLSSFVGEVFASALIKESNGLFAKNPHQDGYPDMLLMDSAGKKLFRDVVAQYSVRNKSSFSPFANGGVEIKATCGIIPSAGVFHRKGTPRPDIGDQRIDYLTGYDWKAHHRLTNNLLALLWDFIDGRAHIVAVFFGANLTQQDWGAIVTPRAGGGRTTSVSIMNASGINKLYNNWLLVIDDQRYIRFLNTKNNGTAIR